MTHSSIQEAGKMIDYRKMYMFHSITDAVLYIGNQQYDSALNVLIRAQQTAEELNIRAGDFDGK
jgi:hypothetical protein